jgi:uncharacterized protein (DUF1499 family)
LSRTTKLILITSLIGFSLPILYLALLSLISRRPANLGVTNGRLAECPSSPNCVSSQAADAAQRMDPIAFSGSADEAFKKLRTIIETLPRAAIVTAEPRYMHVEFTTALFRFVDDTEFLVDADAHVIHFRSASRTGKSDLGVNRQRMDGIRQKFAEH